MDLSTPQELLQRALGQVGRAVATKTTFPVLSNVLIVAEGDEMKLAGTNQEIGITAWIPAGSGSWTVESFLIR